MVDSRADKIERQHGFGEGNLQVGQAGIELGRAAAGVGAEPEGQGQLAGLIDGVDVGKDGDAGRSLVGVGVEKGEAVSDRLVLPDGLVLNGQVEAVRELDQPGRVVKDRIDVGRRVAGEHPIVLNALVRVGHDGRKGQRDRHEHREGENDGFLHRSSFEVIDKAVKCRNHTHLPE